MASTSVFDSLDTGYPISLTETESKRRSWIKPSIPKLIQPRYTISELSIID